MATKADDNLRFELTVSPSANTAIEAIAHDRGVDRGEVIKRAIALFLVVENERKAGETVGIIDRDKKPVVEFVGF